MKKILFLCLFLVSSLFAELEWAESYEAGLAQGLKENKVVMVMLSRDGCPACEYMTDVVFDEDDLVDEIMMDFVPVYIDVTKDKRPKWLYYIGTPTFYFLAPQGWKIDRLDGAANVMDFTVFIRKVKRAVKGE